MLLNLNASAKLFRSPLQYGKSSNVNVGFDDNARLTTCMICSSANENPKEILEKLLKKREENFLKAHYVINTSDLDENQVIEKILGSINEANP